MVHYDNCQNSHHNESLSCMGAMASQPTHFLKFRLTGFRLSEINCIQAYFAAGLAEASHKTYRSAECRYTQFCSDFGLIPCPTNENLLCYFVACLGQQGLSHATIRTYLAGV